MTSVNEGSPARGSEALPPIDDVDGLGARVNLDCKCDNTLGAMPC